MPDITIKRQIDQGYRSYALHVIESRGIPNWYDSLTNGQRILIDNCPSSFTKTLSVVGNAISSGYHAGDASLVSTINKLARTFNCAEPIMNGDGFFGCPVSPSAASARYTSVKINPKIREIINKYYHLNEKNEDGVYEKLSVDIPFGICSGVMGIAVGYKSTILPRKIEDIRDFMVGKRKKVSPYFLGFQGTIKKHGDDKTWIFEGNYEVDEKKRAIRITSIPPMLRFELFLRKLNAILEDVSYNFHNNSSDEVEIILSISKSESQESWENTRDAVIKATKLIVHESIVFVKDKSVIEYECLEEYFLDFWKHNEKTILQHLWWTFNQRTSELEFLEAKLKYLEFVMKTKRTQKEIDEFLEQFPKHIASRLDSLKIRVLNIDEVKKTQEAISDQKIAVKDANRQVQEQKEKVEAMSFELRGKRIKPVDSLFETGEESGIEIFEPEEEQEEEFAI